MGRISGLAKRLQNEECPRLVVIHCLNHRLELAAKGAFKGTFMDTIIDMLTTLYLLYEKSSKRLCELREVGEIMQEHVHKPEKANGTRWLQHKSKACQTLLNCYGVIVGHLQHQASDESDLTAADKAHMKGYLKTLASFKFALYSSFMNSSFMKELLTNSIVKSSLSASKSGVRDLLYAVSLLETFYGAMCKMRTIAAEVDREPTRATTCLQDILATLRNLLQSGTGLRHSGLEA